MTHKESVVFWTEGNVDHMDCFEPKERQKHHWRHIALLHDGTRIGLWPEPLANTPLSEVLSTFDNLVGGNYVPITP